MFEALPKISAAPIPTTGKNDVPEKFLLLNTGQVIYGK
jgi:hypothetical protein